VKHYAQQRLTAAPHRGGVQLEVDKCPFHLPMPCSMRLPCALGKNMPQFGATQACGAQARLAHGVDPGCTPLRCRPPRHRKQKVRPQTMRSALGADEAILGLSTACPPLVLWGW
jgi:hypothetical protein